MRTEQEIEDKLDELAYADFCAGQSGVENYTGAAKLEILNWLLGADYGDLYSRGEKLYKAGVFKWNFEKRAWEKNHMTTQEWLANAEQHKDVLRSLVGAYHPANPDGPSGELMVITAPHAEEAAHAVRRAIAKEEADKPSPLERFDKALQDKNIGEINSLLNSAWFGVPESTSCWRIPGFKEAVDLMDDLPEEE